MRKGVDSLDWVDMGGERELRKVMFGEGNDMFEGFNLI